MIPKNITYNPVFLADIYPAFVYFSHWTDYQCIDARSCTSSYLWLGYSFDIYAIFFIK